MGTNYGRKTIGEVFGAFSEKSDLEALMKELDSADEKLGILEMLDDVIVWVINHEKIYLAENHTSVYSLLGSLKAGTLPKEKSSIHGALKRADALVTLTGPFHRDKMMFYLESHGRESGRGLFDEEGHPIGFTLTDFALHKTKLIPLLDLVQSGEAASEPDWHVFFNSGYQEYKRYCFEKRKKALAPPSAYNSASAQPRIAEERDQDDLGLLDPFSDTGGQSSEASNDATSPQLDKAVHIKVPLPKLRLEKIALGSFPSPTALRRPIDDPKQVARLHTYVVEHLARGVNGS
jgi:hypothetical protein